METTLSLWNFGDSGAFPEFHVKQYPSGFGKHILVESSNNNNNNQDQQQSNHNHNSNNANMNPNNNALMIIQTSKSTLNASSFSADELAKPDQEYINNLEDETRRQLDAARQRTSQVSSGIIGTAGVVGVTSSGRNNKNNKRKTDVIQTDDGRTIAVTEISRDISDPRKMHLNKVSTLEIKSQQQQGSGRNSHADDGHHGQLVLMQQQHQQEVANASLLGGGNAVGPLIRSPTKKMSAKEAQAFAVPTAVYAHRNPKSKLISAEERAKHDGHNYIEQTISDKHALAARAVMEATRRADREDEQRRRDEEAEQERRNEEEKKKLLEQAKASLANQADGSGFGSGTSANDYEERSREMEQKRKLKQLQRTADTLGMDIKDLLAQDDDIEVVDVNNSNKNNNAASAYDSRLHQLLLSGGGQNANPDAALGHDTGLFRNNNNNNINEGGGAASMVNIMNSVNREKLMQEQMIQDSLKAQQQQQQQNKSVVTSAEEMGENETFDEDEDVFGVDAMMK